MLSPRGLGCSSARTTRRSPAHRGTTPIAARRGGHSFAGCDGPTRPVLLRLDGPFFRRLPGDGRINALGLSLAARPRVFRAGLFRTVQPGVDSGQQPGADRVGGATPPRTDKRGQRRPARRRRGRARSWPASYWSASREPNSSGSSAPSATGTPASSSCAQRDVRGLGVDAEATFEDGADLQGDPRRRRAAPSAPGPRRRGRRARSGRRPGRPGRPARWPGRSSSPPCGADSSPARSGDAEGRPSNSRARPRRSSLDSPNPTTPRPAYCAASRARVRASSGCLVRLAATITPMPTPVARVARAPRRGPAR